MLEESRELIFASVAVALLIAVIQGVLGGVAFALTGLPAPVFMGVLIAFFSIVPVVGSALIWVPAAFGWRFSGHWGKAIVGVGDLRRRGGGGGQYRASVAVAQSHAAERFAVVHQHSGRVGCFRLAGTGGRADDCGGGFGRVSSVHGASRTSSRRGTA